jgi:ERCC4-type nuclease
MLPSSARDSDLVVLVDTREQRPFEFPGVETERATLTTGDYSLRYGDVDFRDVFAVERKSLDDLTRSVGTDRSRFEAEVQRASELAGFIIIIEAWQHECEARNYYSRIHPNQVFGTLSKWSQYKYPHMEYEWAGDPHNAAQRALYWLDRQFIIHGTDLV